MTGRMPNREIEEAALKANNPCTTPMTALEDCRQIVAKVPIRRPNQGELFNSSKNERNQGSLAIEDRFSSISQRPKNKEPKAKHKLPMFAHFFFVAKRRIIEPTNKTKGKYSTNGIETIKEVTVVPTFAPIIIALACTKFITPARTSPIVKALVPLDDWMIAVKDAPNKNPKNGLLLNLLMSFDNFEEAIVFKVEDNDEIPNKKRPKPARVKV